MTTRRSGSTVGAERGERAGIRRESSEGQ